MARNIFISTLNSIRSSLHTKGRDVAEAFDAVDQKVGELQKQIAAIKPAQVVAAAPTQVPRALPSVAPSPTGASAPYIPPGGTVVLSPAAAQEISGAFGLDLTDAGSEFSVANDALQVSAALLSFTGHLLLGADVAGTAKITAGNTTKAVNFSSPYTGVAAPIVIITPTTDPIITGVPTGNWVTYAGSSGNWTGFVVNISATLAADVVFNYFVIGQS